MLINTETIRTVTFDIPARIIAINASCVNTAALGALPVYGDLVRLGAAGRQHDDGRRGVLRAQAPADGQAVLAGHHQVEHDEVVAFAGELLVHGRRVACGPHLEPLLPEVAGEHVAQAQVVVDHQDPCLELGHSVKWYR